MGEAIQMAQTISDHLYIAEKFVWLPTDTNLQPHLRTQLIHHEKRRRWGSQLLEGLGQAALSSWENDPQGTMVSLLEEVGGEGGGRNIWTDRRLVRAIMSVALPIGVSAGEEAAIINRPEKEGVWMTAALKGLHVLSGCIAPMAPSSSPHSSSSVLEHETWIDLHRSISMLIQSADELSVQTSLKDAIEARWAIRGLTVRLELANYNAMLPSSVDANDIESNDDMLDFTTPNLNIRTSNLPFDIFPHSLPWQMSTTCPQSPLSSSPSTSSTKSNRNNYYGYPTQDLLPEFLQSIPFNFDTLTTRTGASVIERRGTAWLAEEGVGALAYSGKLMRPVDVPEGTRDVMREMERWCVEQGSRRQPSLQMLTASANDSSPFVEFKWDDCASALPYEELGQFLQPGYEQDSNDLPTFFDCALCNHYPDGDSACKFHTDPEHGTHWHRTTAVVSCGTSRMFAFRPIPEVSIWSEWDDVVGRKSIVVEKQQQHENTPAVFQLFPGDTVFMTGVCNDLFHHAVYSSPFDKSMGVRNSRVSLVFKRALDRGGGRKGHGMAGEGRRSRQRNWR